MSEADWLALRFEEQRAHLRVVAYRMLGSLAEADDAVQNSWLRLSRADTAGVENLAGWLTTVVARECLKILRTRRSRGEEPLDHVGADPSAGDQDVSDPEAQALLADSVGPALMIVLDTLAPAERLAFVLHDIFAVPFDDIALVLERSPAATRQLASRARRRVRGATPSQPVDLARQRQVVDAFLTALREGDFDGLLAVLDPDVRFRDDSAGASGAAALMQGARAVATHALTYSRSAQFVQPALVNGTVGLAIVPHGQLLGALAFTFRHDKIAEIAGISEPDGLRQVDLAALDRWTAENASRLDSGHQAPP
jgi:RNA polymerase sigma factor (sigma-70 family)